MRSRRDLHSKHRDGHRTVQVSRFPRRTLMSKSHPRLPIHGAAAISTARGRAGRVTARLRPRRRHGRRRPHRRRGRLARGVRGVHARGGRPTSRSARSPTSRPAASTASRPPPPRRQPRRSRSSRTPSCRCRRAASSRPTATSSSVAPKAARPGAKLVDRLSDYYAGWPYQFSWSTWPTVVNDQISEIKASGYHEHRRLRAVERVRQHLASRQRHLRGASGPRRTARSAPSTPSDADPGPELLGQHQRHAELPAERRGDQHRARHHRLARTDQRRRRSPATSPP